MKVTCGTVGSGTDEDPYQAYVMRLWPSCNGQDLRDDATNGSGRWRVELVRAEGMAQDEYDAAMAVILADPAVARAD